ncbi:hypothetical protein ARMGADRAFT_1036608 [Armillaria gallica]|uniref:Uncharacterized protein n=1 Tax=Armillaria gallica TaxID=47427 RepID=A0A2H3D123_ARMGA|nr:hypothetical protein ARMGADRAFT_1036608 [Armillaria gallica]
MTLTRTIEHLLQSLHNLSVTKSAALNLHANLEENEEEEGILRGLDEVEAEIYSDNADFTAFADAVDLQINTQAPIAIENVVEVAPVPLATPHVAATTRKGGRKRSNPGKETPDKNDDKASENNDTDDDGNDNGNDQGNSTEGDNNDDEKEEEQEENLKYAH